MSSYPEQRENTCKIEQIQLFLHIIRFGSYVAHWGNSFHGGEGFEFKEEKE